MKKENDIILSYGNIKIRADKYQYVLSMKNYDDTYHTTLEMLFEEIYSRKEKENLIKNKDKSIDGIVKTIAKTRSWLKRMLKPLNGGLE